MHPASDEALFPEGLESALILEEPGPGGSCIQCQDSNLGLLTHGMLLVAGSAKPRYPVQAGSVWAQKARGWTGEEAGRGGPVRRRPRQHPTEGYQGPQDCKPGEAKEVKTRMR